MKKIFFLVFLAQILLTNAIAKELSKDESLSCEAILCLSSATRPSECNNAVKHYYSIKADKPSDTIKKRKKFLSLCPVEDNKELADLKDKILNDEYLYDKCNVDYLNKRIEKKEMLTTTENGSRYVKAYRVNPQTEIPCENIKYICNGNFYSSDIWVSGYKLIKISKDEYNSLPENQKKSAMECNNNSERNHCKTVYYKKEFINKKCWINKI